MGKMIALVVAACLVSMPAVAGDLSARITRFENAGGKDFYILLVVTNKGSRQYEMTKWSCAYRNGNGELVGEDQFYVENIPPNSETPKKSISSSFAPVTSAECRLIDQR
jgi:hypothetical protein